MDKIIEILNGIKEGIDFAEEKHLVDDDLLDSFDVVAIIGELSDVFGVDIQFDDMTPENFNSAESMYALVCRLESEQK